jgi:hypothetical protein
VVLICHWRGARVLINGAIGRALGTQCLRADDAFSTVPGQCVELGVICEDCQRTDQGKGGKGTDSRLSSRRRAGSQTLRVKESGHSDYEAFESRVGGRQREDVEKLEQRIRVQGRETQLLLDKHLVIVGCSKLVLVADLS